MQVKQISVFLENKSGRLSEVCSTLADAEINIRALSIADTTDFGILRLIVNDPSLAFAILKGAGFTVSQTEVIAVSVPDCPGGLAQVLDTLAKAKVNLEYLYAFLAQKHSDALVVFRVGDIPQALSALAAVGIRVLLSEEVYRL